MTDVTWYWEYAVKIWNQADSQEEILSGIVAADSFTDATFELEEYYGDDLMEIQMLKAIMDGVFEFQMASEDKEFNYTINRKL